jgi:ABC-type antimicrobial peptide transport system ATPase subunit
MREAATNKAMMEARIVEMVRLLQSDDPANNLDDITYSEIELEWPLSVQRALVEKISEVISPIYKEIRGN